MENLWRLVGLLVGMQSGFTKFCCFLYLWDSRAVDHLRYLRKVWPSRTHYEPGQQNVSSVSLVNPQKFLLPPLHIKLGLIKNFVETLNREAPASQYLIKLSPKLLYPKIKEGIFVGSDIRKLMAGAKFTKCLTPNEAAAWASFKSAVHNFLGKHKSPDYKRVIDFFFRKITTRLELECLSRHISAFTC